MANTRPSRWKACVQGEEATILTRGYAAVPRVPSSGAHPAMTSPLPLQASCVQYRLVVRDANTLQILQLYTCLDQIQHLEWSADSLFILCALYKRGLVQVPLDGFPPLPLNTAPTQGLVLCSTGTEEGAAQVKARFLLTL